MPPGWQKKYFKKKCDKNYFVRKNSYLFIMKVPSASKSNQPPEPTKSELEILQVLWLHGPATVRFVNDTLNETQRPVQYTSTLKLMQIMVEKGMLSRDERNMKHVYIPVLEEDRMKGQLLDKFVSSLFDGSASKLMMQLLGNNKTSKGEIDAIRKLLEDMDKRNTA
jgi:BlaI family transcriptional regulator, penicillinase repressor